MLLLVVVSCVGFSVVAADLEESTTNVLYYSLFVITVVVLLFMNLFDMMSDILQLDLMVVNDVHDLFHSYKKCRSLSVDLQFIISVYLLTFILHLM